MVSAGVVAAGMVFAGVGAAGMVSAGVVADSSKVLRTLLIFP